MAQAVERNKTSTKAVGATKASAAPTATQTGWRQRLATALAPRPASATAPKRSGMMRMMFGMLAFVVGSRVLFELIAALDLHFNLRLEHATIAPPNTPLLGGLNGLLIIYIVIIGGLWYLLLRYNIIPKDPFGNAAARRAQATRNQQATTTTLRSGPARTRAERRHAATAAEVKATSAKGGSTTKGSSTTKSASVADSGTHDDAYERAAAERARRRRAARR